MRRGGTAAGVVTGGAAGIIPETDGAEDVPDVCPAGGAADVGLMGLSSSFSGSFGVIFHGAKVALAE